MNEIIKEVFQEDKKNDSALINKKLKSVLKEAVGEQYSRLKYRLFINTPILPVLFGFVKTRKDNNPMRLFFKLKGGPMENTGEWILQKLNAIIPEGQFLLKNSEDLVQVLDRFNKNNKDEFILASLDVKSMYQSILVNRVMNILEEVLANKTNEEIKEGISMSKNHFLKILSFYLNNMQVMC